MKTIQMVLVGAFLCVASAAPQFNKENEENDKPSGLQRPLGFQLPPYFQNMGFSIEEPLPTPPLQFYQPEIQLDLGDFIGTRFLSSLFEMIGSLIPTIEIDAYFNMNPYRDYDCVDDC